MVLRKDFYQNLARTAGMLSGASRVAVVLLTTLLPTMTAQTAWATIGGTGTLSDPYTINSADDWDTFASNVSNGTESYEGKYVKLTADISVTTMVGTNSNPFKGTFDGGGHTLTVSYTVTEAKVAPFRYVDGVTIRSLHVAGTITTSNEAAGGLIARVVNGNNTINNCWSSVEINSSYNDGYCYHGGFIGSVANDCTTTFNNCLFDGKLLKKNSTAGGRVGGFVGSKNYTIVNFSGCYCNPSQVTFNSMCYTFCNGANSIEHSYYKTDYFTTDQGTAVGDMTAAEIAAALNNNDISNWQVDGSDNVVPILVPDPHDLRYATVDGLKSTYQYDGENAVEITYTVTDFDGAALEKGTHYTVTLDNVDVTSQTPLTTTTLGNHTLIITGKAPYIQSQTFNFSVNDIYPVTTSTTEMTNGIYKVTEDVTTSNRIIVSGEVTLILGANKTLTASKGIGVSDGNTLTIKGQGTLTATGDSYGNAGIGGTSTANQDNPRERAYGHIIIEGGTIVANGVGGAAGIGGAVGNPDYGNSIIEIKGGVVTATGGSGGAGIGAGDNDENGEGGDGATGTIKILGGQVTANPHSNSQGDGRTAGIGRGNTVGKNRRKGYLVLGWTNETDFIETHCFDGFDKENISFVGDQRFVYDGTKSVASETNIASRWGGKLLPADEHDIELGQHSGDLHMYYLYNDGNPVTITPCTVTTFLGNVLTEGTDYEVKFRNNSNEELDNVTDEGVYTRIIKGKSPYYGQRSAGTFNVSKPIIVYETQSPNFNNFIYIVDHDVTEDDRVEVSGNSTLILNAGTTYTAQNGILVPAGASLTIKGEGTLIAGPSTNNDKAVNGRAGIGGGWFGYPDISYRSHGDIIIEGGHIIAKGSKYAAGIGGAIRSKDEGGKIIIRGGVVEATGGEKAAGIGGGYNYTENYTPDGDGITGNIIIEGGQVTAIAGENGGSAIGKAKDATGTGSKLTIAMTNPADFLLAGSYGVDAIDFDGKSFILDKEGYPAATATNMAGETVRPIAYLTGNLACATVSGVEQTYTYTGSAHSITPVVTAYNETAPLTEGTHYTTVLKKSNGATVAPTEGVYQVTDPDTYTFTFTAVENGGYNGEQTVTFVVSDQMDVTYHDPIATGDDKTKTVTATMLKPTDTELPGGWYVVSSDVNLTNRLNFTGDAYLILADDKTLTINNSDTYYALSCIEVSGESQVYHNLTIYGQTEGTGKVSCFHNSGLAGCSDYFAKNITINGGVVEALGSQNGIIASGGNVTINGGQVSSVNAKIIGTAIMLGWTKATDFIEAYQYSYPNEANNVQFTKTFYLDGTSIEATADNIDGKKLVTFAGLVFEGENAWMGYVAQENLAVPDGLTAYIITAIDETAATATLIDYLPQGVPVLLKRTDTTVSTYTIAAGTGTTPTAGNLLQIANSSNQPTAYQDYVLYKDAFVLVSGGTLANGKVFLPVPQSNGARQLNISIDEETTSINGELRVESGEFATAVEGWYTLDGRKLEGKPKAKGVYIHGGKKEVVR